MSEAILYAKVILKINLELCLLYLSIKSAIPNEKIKNLLIFPYDLSFIPFTPYKFSLLCGIVKKNAIYYELY